MAMMGFDTDYQCIALKGPGNFGRLFAWGEAAKRAQPFGWFHQSGKYANYHMHQNIEQITIPENLPNIVSNYFVNLDITYPAAGQYVELNFEIYNNQNDKKPMYEVFRRVRVEFATKGQMNLVKYVGFLRHVPMPRIDSHPTSAEDKAKLHLWTRLINVKPDHSV